MIRTKITKRKTIAAKFTVLTALVFIPLILIGAFGGFIGFFFNDLASHAFSRELNFYDPNEWNSMSTISSSLDEMDDLADFYQLRQLPNETSGVNYHTPINLSVNCDRWTTVALNNTVRRYHLTDNAGLYTGASLATECIRYKTLTNPAEQVESLKLIKRLATGLSMLMAVPNGGLGPKFPGQTLARFYAMPEQWNDANYSEMFSDTHYKMFNGTDGTAMGGEDYSQWRVRLYTSKDELGGYFFGLAAAIKLIDNPEVEAEVEIRDIIRKIIGQIANGFLDSMYQEVHGDGNPCGAHLENMFTLTGEWKMVLMKMATLAYPENDRYAQLYNYYCTREMYQAHSPHIGESNTVDEYYANGFTHNMLMAYVLMEDNPTQVDRFIKTHERDYKLFRYQRNAQTNAVFLAFNAKRSSTSTRYNQSELDEILHDTLDQLYQFTAYPIYDDSYGGADKAVRREDLGGDWMILDPKIQKWKNFFDYNPIGKLFRWLPGELMDGMLDDRYLKPRTVSMYRVDTFIWNSNPYSPTDNIWSFIRRSSDYVEERIGISYTLPYYLLKYYGYLEGL
ncbi:MAG: hypothetical protein EU530_06390 [Promethearchaeota archaeon]|nr:MAG: hypothetical protein EU530_06390 [Candidatus Lokiarchaeota archaeon]